MIDEKELKAKIEQLKRESEAKWGWIIAEGVYNKILALIDTMPKKNNDYEV